MGGSTYLSKGKNTMTSAPTATQPAKIEPPKTEFVPHRVDPLLSFSEAGRLIGRSHTCIAKWVESGILEAVRGEGKMYRRIRKSDLIRVSGVAAFARQSPYFWEQESKLPENYVYDESWPRPRVLDQITYYPVPMNQYSSEDNAN